MSDPVIQIGSLHKEYHLQRGWKDMILHPRERDTRVALDAIDLEVERGEFFGVLGQNGAGKTTLFKILATLIRPDRGSALVCGIDVEEDPARVREGLIPVIPAERSLYWRLSAYENLRLYASLYGLKGDAAEARIRDTLEIVGLDEVGRKQVGLFSSGMKQRLLIGRALLGDPEILLLDEPTRSLDPVAARAFRTFLKSRIGGERGTTILLATHDHEEVTDLCERVAVLDEGKLIAVGPTETLLSSALLKACSIWTPSPDHPEMEAVVRAAGGTIVSTERTPLGDGEPWHRVRIQLPTDEAGAAEVLASMVSRGVTVSRFTRDDIALADLLERVASGANDPGSGKVA